MLDHMIAHQFYSDRVLAKLLFTHPPTLQAASFRGAPSVVPLSMWLCYFRQTIKVIKILYIVVVYLIA